jgi:hypothetical protein
VAGHDRDRAEFSHRPRIAEDDAVNQTPFHRGQRDVPESFQAAGPQRQGRLFLAGAGRLHHGNQFAGDEWESDEDRGEHNARHGENNFDVAVVEPGSEVSLQAKEQHIHQASDDR